MRLFRGRARTTTDPTVPGWTPRTLAVGLVVGLAGTWVGNAVHSAGDGPLDAVRRMISAFFILCGGVGLTAAVAAGATMLLCQWEPVRIRRSLVSGPWWARGREFDRHLSAAAVRRLAVIHRPSLPRWSRWVMRTREFGVYLGRTVVGPLVPRRAYATQRDVVCVIAPPQTGKTAFLGGRIVDAPGPVVVTSTKADIYEESMPGRSASGSPILVFNPEGLGGVPSTLRWSPVAGCEDPATATERAAYLVTGAGSSGLSDADFWNSQSVRVLRALLMAAAVDGRTIADVARWVSDPQQLEPLNLLMQSDTVPESWVEDLRSVLQSAADRTVASIYATLGLALQFMSDPAVAEACTPGPWDGFDVDRFLQSRGTLYLLGAEKVGGSTTPLLTAFTGMLFEGAKRRAAQAPAGRLDPPLSMILDEAALICPVPLHRWTADAGGRGIQLMFAVQSPSQLAERWGHLGASTIWNNSNAKLILGGLTNVDDLEQLSVLCGTRPEATVSRTRGQGRGQGGHSTTTSSMAVRVLTPDQLRMLPQWHALVLARSAPPSIVRITPVWRHRRARTARADYTKGKVPAPTMGERVVDLRGWARAHRPGAGAAGGSRPVEGRKSS